MAGLETVRQEVTASTAFTQNRRDTNSAFVALRETWRGQRLEASARRDEDGSFGARNTSSVSYGAPWPGVGILTGTVGRGFRAPSFFELYAPPSDFYVPNPDLKPEQSRSAEVSLRSLPGSPWPWRVTGFDNRIEDLITYVHPTVLNVRSARIRGVEASVEGRVRGTFLKASLTAQRPRDEDTGYRLQGRAERFGRVEAARAFGNWLISGGVTASGPRYDSADESPDSKLGGYTIADATLRYTVDRRWKVELVASNLFDKRYEQAVGYDAPRRGILLNVSFEGR